MKILFIILLASILLQLISRPNMKVWHVTLMKSINQNLKKRILGADHLIRGGAMVFPS